jgi:hypothetical protein
MITLHLTPAQSSLLIEAMLKRIDRSNQKLKYWRAHPENAPPGCEITEAQRQGMLRVLIETLEKTNEDRP